MSASLRCAAGEWLVVPASTGKLHKYSDDDFHLSFRPSSVFVLTPESRAVNRNWPGWMHAAWSVRPIDSPGSVRPVDFPDSDGKDHLVVTTAAGKTEEVLFGDSIARNEDGTLYVVRSPSSSPNRKAEVDAPSNIRHAHPIERMTAIVETGKALSLHNTDLGNRFDADCFVQDDGTLVPYGAMCIGGRFSAPSYKVERGADGEYIDMPLWLRVRLLSSEPELTEGKIWLGDDGGKPCMFLDAFRIRDGATLGVNADGRTVVLTSLPAPSCMEHAVGYGG